MHTVYIYGIPYCEVVLIVHRIPSARIRLTKSMIGGQVGLNIYVTKA